MRPMWQIRIDRLINAWRHERALTRDQRESVADFRADLQQLGPEARAALATLRAFGKRFVRDEGEYAEWRHHLRALGTTRAWWTRHYTDPQGKPGRPYSDLLRGIVAATRRYGIGPRETAKYIVHTVGPVLDADECKELFQLREHELLRPFVGSREIVDRLAKRLTNTKISPAS